MRWLSARVILGKWRWRSTCHSGNLDEKSESV